LKKLHAALKSTKSLQ